MAFVLIDVGRPGLGTGESQYTQLKLLHCCVMARTERV